MKIGKLVRNRIPEIIERSGKKPIYRILDEAEYKEALEKKLDEEVAEWHESKNVEELADIYEVILALFYAHDFDIDTFNDVLLAKFNERGGFGYRIFLEEVIESV